MIETAGTIQRWDSGRPETHPQAGGPRRLAPQAPPAAPREFHPRDDADLQADRPVDSPAGTPASLRVEWMVSAHALHAVRPDLTSDAPAHASLAWIIPLSPAAGDPRASLILHAGGREPIELARALAPAEVETIEGVLHLQVPGVLTAALKMSPASRPADAPAPCELVRVLYARFDLAAWLGLPGGTYELAGAWTADPDRPAEPPHAPAARTARTPRPARGSI